MPLTPREPGSPGHRSQRSGGAPGASPAVALAGGAYRLAGTGLTYPVVFGAGMSRSWLPA